MCSGTSYANYSNLSQSQCSPPRDTGRDAAKNLASLMERQLNLGHIDPIALRLFIRAYWSRVSTYAHTIHDDRD